MFEVSAMQTLGQGTETRDRRTTKDRWRDLDFVI